MKNLRKVKIVATVDPSSSDATTLRRLAEAGVNVFRINFSHGSHEDHLQRYQLIREVEKSCGHLLGIMVDLQGPKLRIESYRVTR